MLQIFLLLFILPSAYSQPTPVILNCGATIGGSTIGETSNFDASDYGNCYNGTSNFDGPDQLFIIEKQEVGRMNISLFNGGGNDLDLFLFDASLTNCIAASLKPLDQNLNFDEIIDTDEPLPTGTYYLVVDGYDVNQADEFVLSVACNPLDCSSAEEIEGGSFLDNQDNSTSANNIHVYQSNGEFVLWNNGPEKLYYFDLPTPELVTIVLDDFLAPQDFQLVLLSACDEYAGIAHSSNGAGQSEEIIVDLSPGRYFILVDGYNGTAGTFDLSVDWEGEGTVETGPISIECGQVLEGSTVNAVDDFNASDYTDCIDDFSLNYYEYADVLYRFDLAYTQNIKIELDILSEELNLDLFLFESEYLSGSPGMPQPGSCIAVSENLSFIEKSLYMDLNPGTYWIGIDGGLFGDVFGPLPPDKGLFRLNLSCFFLDSPCDLEGKFISNGTTSINSQVGLLEPFYFSGISCVENDYLLSTELFGDVYTYYSEEDVYTAIEVNSDNPSINAYIFDCNGNNIDELCIGKTSELNKSISFNARADNYYQVVILSPTHENSSYQLSIPSPDGPCGNDPPEVLFRGSTIAGTLEGAGNDFDANTNAFFQNCASGNFLYNGEDRVFQIDVSTYNESEIDYESGIYDNILSLEAGSGVGLFLFNYQCGESNCLASIELPEGGGTDTLDLNLYIKKSGTYYLVLDKQKSNGNDTFSLTRSINNFDIFCEPESADQHRITFSNNILNRQSIVKKGDVLIVDYKNKKYIGEVIYEKNTFTVNSGTGNVPDITLFGQDPVFSLPGDSIVSYKCGFEPGEEFEFKVIKENGLILVLDPVFDPTPIFANPPTAFQPGTTTRVKDIRLNSQERPVKVDFEEDNVNLNALPSSALSFSAHIDANTGWEIFGLASIDWLNIYDAQLGPQGPNLTQGQGQKKVLVTVAENSGNEIRRGVFEIIAENGFARRVIINQLPNPCGSSAMNVTENITDVFCQGEASGEILLIPTEGETLEFNWADGTSGAERSNLPAGNYQVTVSDETGCESSLEFTINEPGEALAIDLALPASEVCAGEVSLASVSISGGTPDYTVQWSNGTTGLFNNNLTPGNYSVTVKDAQNCSETETFKIESFPLQDIQIAGDRSICSGESTTLSLNGFQSYRWSTGATAASIVVNTSGNYSVEAEDANGCTVLAGVQVEVYDKPQPVIAGSTSVCPGSFTELSLNGYSSYQWSTGASTSSIVRDSPGLVSVTVTNTNGCSGTASVDIVENEVLQPQIAGEDNLCQGEETNLDAGVFATYSWSTGAATQTIPVNSTGEYEVTVTDQSGCVGVDAFSVQVNENPEPVIIGDSFLCYGEVTALSVNGDFTQYIWSNNTVQPTIEVSTSNIYRVSVTDKNGCMGTDEIEVFVNPEIELNQLEFKGISCFGSLDGSINVLVTGGTGELSYRWTPNLGDLPNLEALAPGTYQLTVTDENNCSLTADVELTEPTPLTLSVDSIRNEVGDSLGIIMVHALGGIPPYTYYWTWPGGGRQTNFPNSGGLPNGSYDLKVEDANGCEVILENLEIDLAVPTHNLYSSGNNLKVYPNPGKGIFYLEWQNDLSEDAEVKIVNIVGSTITILNSPKSSKKILLDLSLQPSGVYFLLMTGKQGTIVQKIVIEK